MTERMKLDGVRRECYGRALLDELTLSVHAGEFVGLVGPNGAGKTTLLRTMAGLLEVDGGVVSFDRVALPNMDRRRLAQHIAVVPQSAHFGDFRFSSKEVVLMGRYPHRGRWQVETAADHEIAATAMERTHTVTFTDRVVTELSGGERQRVTLARALAQTPRVLLLDEPTASLDLGHQLQVLRLVRRLVDEDGMTAVAALHDLSLASRYCDRLVLMEHGRIVADGRPVEVLTPDRLAEVYRIRAHVEPHPLMGGLMIHVLDVLVGHEEEVTQ
jgi:iron complex transport system ATP-binding protein